MGWLSVSPVMLLWFLGVIDIRKKCLFFFVCFFICLGLAAFFFFFFFLCLYSILPPILVYFKRESPTESIGKLIEIELLLN